VELVYPNHYCSVVVVVVVVVVDDDDYDDYDYGYRCYY
jgi:hypothetical protein